MEMDEKNLLDRLILQDRKADAENTEEDEPKDPTPDDPGQDDDPDDDKPEPPDEPEPDDPEDPKPDEENCRQLTKELKKEKAEIRGAVSLHDGAQKAVNDKTEEVKRKREAYEHALREFAAKNGIALWDISKGRIPRDVQLSSNLSRAKVAYETARRESKILIDELRRTRELLEQARERVSELHDQIDAAGCGT